jgi:hypothetical protein
MERVLDTDGGKSIFCRESLMADVEVYYFVAWDPDAGQNVRSKRPATLEAIKRRKGEPIQDTRSVVDSQQVDGNGFLLEGRV